MLSSHWNVLTFLYTEHDFFPPKCFFHTIFFLNKKRTGQGTLRGAGGNGNLKINFMRPERIIFISYQNHFLHNPFFFFYTKLPYVIEMGNDRALVSSNLWPFGLKTNTLPTKLTRACRSVAILGLLYTLAHICLAFRTFKIINFVLRYKNKIW